MQRKSLKMDQGYVKSSIYKLSTLPIYVGDIYYYIHNAGPHQMKEKKEFLIGDHIVVAAVLITSHANEFE